MALSGSLTLPVGFDSWEDGEVALEESLEQSTSGLELLLEAGERTLASDGRCLGGRPLPGFGRDSGSGSGTCSGSGSKSGFRSGLGSRVAILPSGQQSLLGSMQPRHHVLLLLRLLQEPSASPSLSWTSSEDRTFWAGEAFCSLCGRRTSAASAL